ncbi:MAG: RsmF rRNA methyltransferase first C-terminal domain-containing protein [Anaerolineae bacterium]|nr:RsmF rRNA methyltransferase first C-terminal domain-containing protein [Anaerolineae bacterium]
MTLPVQFAQRMRALLDVEADAFLAALEQPPRAGLRVNTLKLAPDHLLDLLPASLTPLPWCPTGFLVQGDEPLGKHPYHAAGLYYLQEPSAMAVAEALAPRPGDLVLDLAAAPGGKSTHLASLMGDEGLLVANEVETSRTRALAENLERWGVRQAVITNDDPRRLAERWGPVFDRVLVDAPCSGEGMFRKSPAALAQWSEKLVEGCSLRQRRLLDTAAELVRPGGWLAYSTCTFAPEENEAVIAAFLARHAGFELRPLTLTGAALGRPDWLPDELARPDLSHTARLWPHRVTGEGHFVALLQRAEGPKTMTPRAKVKDAPRPVRAAWRAFVQATLGMDPVKDAVLTTRGAHVYALPTKALDMERVKTVRAGLWLGTLERGRFEPSHSLALALRSTDEEGLEGWEARRLDFAPDDDRLRRYLQGHPLEEPGEAGWVLMTVSGYPIGWGRRAQGIIKNFYPKGLRWH